MISTAPIHFSPMVSRTSGSAISATPVPTGSATAVTIVCALTYAAFSRGGSPDSAEHAGNRVPTRGIAASRDGAAARLSPTT